MAPEPTKRSRPRRARRALRARRRHARSRPPGGGPGAHRRLAAADRAVRARAARGRARCTRRARPSAPRSGCAPEDRGHRARAAARGRAPPLRLRRWRRRRARRGRARARAGAARRERPARRRCPTRPRWPRAGRREAAPAPDPSMPGARLAPERRRRLLPQLDLAASAGRRPGSGPTRSAGGPLVTVYYQVEGRHDRLHDRALAAAGRAVREGDQLGRHRATDARR